MPKTVSLMAMRIRQLRLDRDWTQDELAEKVGTTKATISKIELGQRRLTFEWLDKFSDAFSVEVGSFYDPGREERNKVNKLPMMELSEAKDWKAIAKASFSSKIVVGANEKAFVIIVDNRSLDRIAPPGAFAIIDPDKRLLHDGFIYLVLGVEGANLRLYKAEPARFESGSTDGVVETIMLGQRPFEVVGQVTKIILEFEK